MNVDLLQASFQQRCERSDKLRAVLTTGRWFAITPTGPSTERWGLNDEMCKPIATRYLIMMEIQIMQRK